MAFIKNLKGSSNISGSSNGWTIKKRIRILALTGMTITLILGAISVYSLNKIDKDTTNVSKKYVPEWASTAALDQSVSSANRSFLLYINSGSKADYDAAIAKFDTVNDQLKELDSYLKIYDLPVLASKIGD